MNKNIISFFVILFFWLFGFVMAEWSNDLIQDGWWRAQLRNASILKVYAKPWETINLWSNTGAINYSAPDGSSGSCTATSNLTNTTQESAWPLPNVWGYVPCTVTVWAWQEW
jgi:hypothetical protein